MGVTISSPARAGKERRDLEVGSYRLIHNLRSMCAVLFARRILTEFPDERALADELIESLVSNKDESSERDRDYGEDTPERLDEILSDPDRFDLAPDYEYWRETRDSLPRFVYGERARFSVWKGLVSWIDCSDADARHSAGEVLDIATMFAFVLPGIRKMPKSDTKTALTEIAGFYRTAWKEGREVEFN